MNPLPEHIVEKIQDAEFKYYGGHTVHMGQSAFNKGACMGYQLAEPIMKLAQETMDNQFNLLVEKDTEIEELKAWKAEAISVMPDYQAIGKALNIKLGESVHDKILPEIERLKGILKQVMIDNALKYISYMASNEERNKMADESWQNFKRIHNI